MLEDILEQYKDQCTRSGQFPILMSLPVMLIAIFAIGSAAGVGIVLFLNEYFLYISEFASVYIVLFIIIVMMFIYIAFIHWCVFHIQKKYVKNYVRNQIEKEGNQIQLEALQNQLNLIESEHFKRKYILKFNGNTVDKEYNKIKFDEFLKKAKIQDKKIAEELIEGLTDFYKQNFKKFEKYVDAALVGVIAFTVLEPILNSISEVFFGDSQIALEEPLLLLFYFLAILPFAIIPISLKYAIQRMNINWIMSERRVAFNLAKKLKQYNFDDDQ